MAANLVAQIAFGDDAMLLHWARKLDVTATSCHQIQCPIVENHVQSHRPVSLSFSCVVSSPFSGGK